MTKHKPIYANVLYCDGGCNNQTHTGGYGSYAILEAGQEIQRQTRRAYRDVTTSQEAEYQALYDALHWLFSTSYRADKWYQVWTDSQLVVKQTRGEWGCKAENLIPHLERVSWLLEHMPTVKISWTPRAEIVKRLGH